MRGRAEFGESWWARAWIDALEGRAQLDPNRLPRGRTYARQARVEGLTVVEGSIEARVYGRRPHPYRVKVRVRRFRDDEWAAVVQAIAARAAHAAALLDGELLPEIADDAERAGAGLLPGSGEIGPSCSCPDWADPCKHAAAVCYLTARLIDEDPFALFLLRGRDRDALLGMVRAERSHEGGILRAGIPPRRPVDEGVVARDRYRAGIETTPLPVVPAPPVRPGRPAVLTDDPPPASGLGRDVLRDLAGDAAVRAWELCNGLGDGGVHLDPELDLARLAAAALEREELTALADRTGMPRAELARAGIAWLRGGAGGVETMTGSWTPTEDEIDEGRRALESVGSVRRWRNRLTASANGLQLRLGTDGRWYLLRQSGARWELDAPPGSDPAALVAEAIAYALP